MENWSTSELVELRKQVHNLIENSKEDLQTYYRVGWAKGYVTAFVQCVIGILIFFFVRAL